jgi:hypothetical protein
MDEPMYGDTLWMWSNYPRNIPISTQNGRPVRKFALWPIRYGQNSSCQGHGYVMWSAFFRQGAIIVGKLCRWKWGGSSNYFSIGTRYRGVKHTHPSFNFILWWTGQSCSLPGRHRWTGNAQKWDRGYKSKIDFAAAALVLKSRSPSCKAKGTSCQNWEVDNFPTLVKAQADFNITINDCSFLAGDPAEQLKKLKNHLATTSWTAIKT